MPVMKKSSLTQTQVNALLNARNNAVTYAHLTPREKFEEVMKKHYRKSRFGVRKFHFKAIACGIEIHVFNGIGKAIGVYENDIKGLIKAREVSRTLFFSAPIEDRNGGYCFDFFKDDLVRIDLTLGFSN